MNFPSCFLSIILLCHANGKEPSLGSCRWLSSAFPVWGWLLCPCLPTMGGRVQKARGLREGLIRGETQFALESSSSLLWLNVWKPKEGSRLFLLLSVRKGQWICEREDRHVPWVPRNRSQTTISLMSFINLILSMVKKKNRLTGKFFFFLEMHLLYQPYLPPKSHSFFTL